MQFFIFFCLLLASLTSAMVPMMAGFRFRDRGNLVRDAPTSSVDYRMRLPFGPYSTNDRIQGAVLF